MSKPLLELMLEHDVQWPDGAVCAVQSYIGSAIMFSRSKDLSRVCKRGRWRANGGGWIEYSVILLKEQAINCETAIVTRSEYESAHALIGKKGEQCTR